MVRTTSHVNHRITLFSGYLLVLSVAVGACGSEDPERPFRLADVPAENLIRQGMEKSILDDTVVSDASMLPLGPVLSSDGSKILAIEQDRVTVADEGDSSTTKVIYDRADAPEAAYLFDPRWSADGAELGFRELIPAGQSDSTFMQMRVVIALGEGSDE